MFSPRPALPRGLDDARRRTSFPLTLVTGLLVAACEVQPAPHDQSHSPRPDGARDESAERALIGGFVADDARLDAIGAMISITPSGANEHLCGAALIAPETVLTAKHCAALIPAIVARGYTIAFVVGPNIYDPRRIVQVASFAVAPGDEGGFIGVGHDVAVLHLDQPITDIAPVAMGTIDDADIGRRFAAVGYGVQDVDNSLGTRRLGRQTLKGRQGRVLEHLFGSFARYLDYVKTGDPAADASATKGSGAGVRRGHAAVDVRPARPSVEEKARIAWEQSVLLTDHEVVTGGVPGDAQPCAGDSGSPLLRHQGGRLVTYGVVSGGLPSRFLPCDFGTVYATFGPGVRDFVDAARAWTDPCGDMDTRGSCEGEVATRCTNMTEGRRRISAFDCGVLGLTCNPNGGQRQDEVTCDETPADVAQPMP